MAFDNPIATNTQGAQALQAEGTGVYKAVGQGFQDLVGAGFQHATEQRDLSIAEAEKMKEARIAEGAMLLKNMRNSLATQGANARLIQEREMAFLARYDNETALAINSTTNKLTGRNLSSIQDDARAVAEDKLNKRKTYQALSPFLTRKVNLDTASSAEIDEAILEASAAEAEWSHKQQRANYEAVTTSNSEASRRIRVRELSDNAFNFATNAFLANFKEGIESIDLNDPAQVKAAVSELNQFKIGVPEEVHRASSDMGVVLSNEEAKNIENRIYRSIEGLQSVLQQDSVLKAIEGSQKGTVYEVIDIMTKGTPDQQLAAQAWLSSKALNLPIQSRDFRTYMETVMRYSSGAVPRTNNPDPASGEAEDVGAWSRISRTFSAMFSSDEEVPEDVRKLNTDIILNGLSGSNDKIEQVIREGGFAAILDGVANGNPEFTLDTRKYDEIAETFKPLVEQTLVGTIAGLKETTSSGVTIRYDSQSMTVSMTTPDGKPYFPKRSRKITKLIQDSAKLYEKLGKDKAWMDAYKQMLEDSFNVGEEDA